MSDETFDPTVPEDTDATMASAYLDGVATSDERALVETSPDALDMVRQFGDVRTVLSATAPEASLSQREHDLSTALDVWERMSDVERLGDAAAADSTGSTKRAARRNRRRRNRGGPGDGFGASQWFVSAAAALVVLAGGAVIVRGILTADDADTEVATAVEASEAAPNVEDVDALIEAELKGEDVGSDGILPAEQIEDQAAVDGSADDGLFTESAADAASAEEASADSNESESDDSAAGEQPAPAADEEELVELVTPTDLANFGGLVLATLAEGPVVTSNVDFEPPADSCESELDIEAISGYAEYQGQTVKVGVDIDLDVVIAYLDETIGSETCEFITSVPLSARTVTVDTVAATDTVPDP